MMKHNAMMLCSVTMVLLLLLVCHHVTLGNCFSVQHRWGGPRVEALSAARRDFIISAGGVATSVLPWRPSPSLMPTINCVNAEEKAPYERIIPTKKTAQYIAKFCNAEFLSSVIESNYNFLYRGLSPDEGNAVEYNKGLAAIVIKDEPYDLLSPDTYGSNEAAAYFQSLEEEMTSKGMSLKPSIGHLGTTCPKEAAQWGRAASIWPLGEKEVAFAWLEEGGVFWTIDDDRKERRILSQSANKRDTMGKGQSPLAGALQGDAWEIMFHADDGFLAVPSEFDDELRSYLSKLR